MGISLSDLGIKGKIFCISMQRSGTTSVGFFLERWGLKHLSRPVAMQNKLFWTRHVLDQNYKRVFSSEFFDKYEVFEDDPFWLRDFYKILHKKFPGSKFILLERDSSSWFKSMIRHSNGYSTGISENHARIYEREQDFEWLKKNIPDFDGRKHKMVIFDKPEHYMNIYEKHYSEARQYFDSEEPDALFYGMLNDKDIWRRLSQWLNLPEVEGEYVSHRHKSSGPITVSQIKCLNEN